ncbi:MAG TPA: response regulator transcription factor [Anaerovoracaceae bacterium]|nr:response regulator transcription factor [Anaerovoracaceae bacterium]
MSNEKILVVDDDRDIVDILRIYLENEGYQFFSASNYEEALRYTKTGIDLIILDVLLPGKDGFDICLELRKSITAPILFLSCKNDEMDKIIGLSVGGDDYIEKPFLPGELMARIRSNIRRSTSYSAGKQNSAISLGALRLDPVNREAAIQARPIQLLPKEFDILHLFCRNPNRLFTKEEIFEFVWKDRSFETDVNTIMVHISNLRKKMGSNPSSPQIITIKGLGYKLVWREASKASL